MLCTRYNSHGVEWYILTSCSYLFRLKFFPPDWGMLRRSRGVLIFLSRYSEGIFL